MSGDSTPLPEHERAVLIGLCRPMVSSASSAPASSQEIGDDIFLATDAVEAHLRLLADRFEVGELPRKQQRRRLAQIVLDEGIVRPEDY